MVCLIMRTLLRCVVNLLASTPGEKMAKIFYYLIKTVGRSKTMDFIRVVSEPFADTLPIYSCDLLPYPDILRTHRADFLLR
jgi:hypothetical protein